MRITILNHEEHTVLFPSPVGPITLKLVSSEIKKSMDRFARNHDVSWQTAANQLNHNITSIFRPSLGLEIPLLPTLGCHRFFSHVGGTTVVEKGRALVDAARMGGQLLFRLGLSRCILIRGSHPATCWLLHVLLLKTETYRYLPHDAAGCTVCRSCPDLEVYLTVFEEGVSG